jgi:hypothetical protein
MRHSIPWFVAFVVVALAVRYASSDPPHDNKGSGVLSVLHPDQPVAVKKAGGRYEITVMPKVPGPLGHQVVEVGSNYLVVQDLVGVTETRIPIWSIKCVSVLRAGGK